ncbi:(2Fe-2S)-binding protein [Spirosoma gilvum]
MIHFTVGYNQQEIAVQTSHHSHPSLMSLLSDYLSIPGFGLCSGMGSCGTCVVYVDGMRVLSCELAINDELDDSRIIVKDTLG